MLTRNLNFWCCLWMKSSFNIACFEIFNIRNVLLLPDQISVETKLWVLHTGCKEELFFKRSSAWGTKYQILCSITCVTLIPQRACALAKVITRPVTVMPVKVPGKTVLCDTLSCLGVSLSAPKDLRGAEWPKLPQNTQKSCARRVDLGSEKSSWPHVYSRSQNFLWWISHFLLWVRCCRCD